MAFVGAFDARQTGGRRTLSPQYEEDTTLGGVHLQNLPTVESSGRGSGSLEIETSAPKPQLSIRKKMYLTLEKPSYSPLAKLISISMMLLILLSTVSFIMEGEVTVGSLPHDPWFYIFDINTVSIFVFNIQYLLRILLCDRRVSFFFNLMNLVDLAAFLPGLVTFILKNADPDGASGGFDGVAFLRVMRLVRVFRIFKFGKYSGGIQMFAGALRMSYKPLGVLVLILLIATVISASLLHMIERQLPSAEFLQYYLEANGFDDAKHDECFGTIVRGFWWAIVTMTTVGYGDCSPITAGGKVVGGVVCVGGIILIAMPITVIGSNFAKMVELFSDEMDNDYEVSATRPSHTTRLPPPVQSAQPAPPAAPPRQVDANNSGTIESSSCASSSTTRRTRTRCGGHRHHDPQPDGGVRLVGRGHPHVRRLQPAAAARAQAGVDLADGELTNRRRRARVAARRGGGGDGGGRARLDELERKQDERLGAIELLLAISDRLEIGADLASAAAAPRRSPAAAAPPPAAPPAPPPAQVEVTARPASPDSSRRQTSYLYVITAKLIVGSTVLLISSSSHDGAGGDPSALAPYLARSGPTVSTSTAGCSSSSFDVGVAVDPSVHLLDGVLDAQHVVVVHPAPQLLLLQRRLHAVDVALERVAARDAARRLLVLLAEALGVAHRAVDGLAVEAVGIFDLDHRAGRRRLPSP